MERTALYKGSSRALEGLASITQIEIDSLHSQESAVIHTSKFHVQGNSL